MKPQVKKRDMNVNANYLIENYANAVEKLNDPMGDRVFRSYWTGVKDGYLDVLNAGFLGWTDYDNINNIGYYVFNEGMTYNAAVAAYKQNLVK